MNNLTIPFFLFFLSTVVFAESSPQLDGTAGPGIDNRARSAGSFIKDLKKGGRMVQFHRGYLYIMGQGSTTLWDISDVSNPLLLDEKDLGDNGHRWWKLNTDIFWREYSTPEISGSGFHFMDMSNLFDLKPWTDASIPVPIAESGQLEKWQRLETFPIGTNGGNVHDNRTQDPLTDPDAILSTFPTGNLGVNSSLRFRIGNLLFIFGNGLAVLDIGDPNNVVFLDSLSGEFQQYTTTYHVWRHHAVFLNGDNSNRGDNNLVTIDFSDPTDLKFGFGVPFEDSPGRYMYFQDQYGFAGSDKQGVKLNMDTGEVVQRFTAPGDWPLTFLDYQWIPLGPVIMSSGSNGDDGRTFFYAHQDGPDMKGPEVGFHHPFADSTNNPVTSVIGFAIAETLDERTLNSETIQVRAVGSEELVDGDVVWGSYQVANFAPKHPLQPDTTYEVKLVQGGIKDVAGNGIEEFVFHFSTGDGLDKNNVPVIENVSTGTERPVPVNRQLNFSVIADDADGDTLEYRWDFNEGGGNTDWRSSHEISYRFDSPGVKTITVQVRDNRGGLTALSVSVIVVAESSGELPVQSNQMVLDKSTNKLWVVNPDNNTVAVIDSHSLIKVNEIAVCARPTGIALDSFRQLWITCRNTDSVQILSADSGALRDTLSLGYGSQPYAVVADPSGTKIYITETGAGGLIRVDAQSRTNEERLDLGGRPRAMAISGTGDTLLVTRFISTDTEGIVWKIDLAGFTVEAEIALTVDTTTPDSGSNGRGVPNYLASVAISRDGTRAWVAGKKDNILRGLARDGNPLTFETSVRNALSPLDLNANNEIQALRQDIDDHAQPSAITYSPLGSHLLIAMQGNNRVIVLNPQTGREITRTDTGLAPQSILIEPESNRVFVKNFMGRSVSVFDADAMLKIGTTEMPLIATINTVTSDALSSLILQGKRIFYNAADTRMGFDGYISCAVCHIDGEQDGRTWDFTDRGEGLRNTIALRGRAGTGHGRVHWSANFDEIQDFEHDIRGPFNGSGFMSDADFHRGTVGHPLGDAKVGISPELDALSAYVRSLNRFDRSPFRQTDGTLTAEAAMGRLLFISQGCALCHGGEDFSDSERGLSHDIGTLKESSGARLNEPLLGIDTPTLRDIWKTAPYFHDGSAATLNELLVINQNDRHGFTGSLTADQRRQLVAYLQQVDSSEPAPNTEVVELQIDSVTAGENIKQGAVPLSIATNLEGITRVDYYIDGQKVAHSVQSPFSTEWTPTKTGTYRLQAKTIYNDGNTASLTQELWFTYGNFDTCRVDYTIANEWNDGFQVNLTITNRGDTEIRGVQLSWQLGNTETFDNGWNATFSSEGNLITASIAESSWNGVIAANGGSTSFGFVVSKVGDDVFIPQEFLLNDQFVCLTQSVN